MTSNQTIERVDLAALANRLQAHWQCLRVSGDDRVVLIAGTNGSIKPSPEGLVLNFKPSACAARHAFDRLDDDGMLIAGSNGAILVGRLPTYPEARLLRQLLGLVQRGQGG